MFQDNVEIIYVKCEAKKDKLYVSIKFQLKFYFLIKKNHFFNTKNHHYSLPVNKYWRCVGVTIVLVRKCALANRKLTALTVQISKYNCFFNCLFKTEIYNSHQSINTFI